jgi:hypothetical protein
MELPISVMIVLFVAIVVGIVVIGFANTSLDRARDDIRVLGRDDPEKFEDKLVSVPALSSERIKSLGMQCVRDYQGYVAEELCFVVRSIDSSDPGIQQINDLNDEVVNVNGNNWTFRVDITGNPNVVFVYYNPVGRIHVSS